MTTMEDSTEWLEAMKGVFYEEMSDGNYVKCKEIIELLKDEGFPIEAKQLQADLVEEKLGTFIHETDARAWK